MPELEVTRDQLERLDALRERLADQVVGKYGHVRRRDAVEYLLDRYADEMGELDAAGVEAAVAGEDDVEPAAAGTDGADAEDDGATAAGDDGDPTANAPPADGDGDGAAMLDAMMSLLDENADHWREAGGGDHRYEVDLPDGGTEPARTKDDVRALLFQHYR
jgi:hypothetical protein